MPRFSFSNIKKIKYLWFYALAIGVVIFVYYQFRVIEGNDNTKPVCNYDACQNALTEYQNKGWAYGEEWWNEGQGCYGCTKVKYGENLPDTDKSQSKLLEKQIEINYK